MDIIALDGAWTASLAAAGMTGWVVGWCAHARARMLDDNSVETERHCAPPKPDQGIIDGHLPCDCQADCDAGGHHAPERCVFDAMPPIEDVRAQAAAIRLSEEIWSKPGVLSQLEQLAIDNGTEAIPSATILDSISADNQANVAEEVLARPAGRY